MKKIYFLLVVAIMILCGNISNAQVSGANIFLPGNFLEIGIAPNGSWGPGTAPAGYYPNGAAYPNNLAHVYDWQHNGWTTGTPATYGDYTVPGTPFEGWSIQANGTRYDAFFTSGGGFTYTGALLAPMTGSNVSYTNAGGTITGTWQGAVPGLSITQATRVDVNASWAVVTTTITNTTGAAIPGVYYWRTCDPDDDVTHSGSYYTINSIVYQAPTSVDNRVMVSSTGVTYKNAYMALGTKDCRAKSMIYTLWSPTPTTGAANTLDKIYNQTAGFLGTSYYTIGNQTNADIAMGLIYNLGTLAAGASTTISYAYIYGSDATTATATNPFNPLFTNAIDSAFPEPLLVVNGVPGPPSGPAPAPTYDTFRACNTGITTLPVNINFASDKVWTGSTWTWSPATGLASTTGVTNTININSLPPSITYTLTGSNPAFCNSRVMYLTVLSCNGATVNTPCIGDPLTFNAPGDSTGATYLWYGPAPSTTVVSTSQSFTITPTVWADTGTYHVVKTVGTVSDTAFATANFNPLPVVNLSSSIPNCTPMVSPFTLSVTPGLPGETYSWTGPVGFTSTQQNPTISPFGLPNVGTYQVLATTSFGCKNTGSITIHPNDPITGVASLCQRRATTTLSDDIPGGAWSSATPAIATITSNTGIVHGVGGGVATISYLNSYGCAAIYTVTVDPTPPPPGVTPQSYCQYFTPALQLTATGAGPTFTWYGPGLTAGYFPAPTPSTLVPGVDSYYVFQTSSFGCASDSALELVTVRPFPSTPVPRDTEYCQYFGNPAPLDQEVTGYTGTLNWYLSGTPLGGTPTPSTANPTYPNGTTWYVSQTVNGCEGDSAALNVKIVYLPNFTIANRPWVCQFDSISLAYVPAGPALINGSFLWSIPSGSSFAGGTNQADSAIMIQFDSSNNNNYVYLTVGNLNGECSTTDTVLIDVVELPTANATSKADVCMSDTVALALSSRSVSASDFVWYVDTDPLFSSPAVNIIASNSNNGGPYSISWVDTGIHVIHVEAYAEHGCTDKPTSDTVNVHPLPDATFRITTLGGTLCLQDSVLFSANDSNYQNRYNWSPAHFFNATDKHAEWGRVELDQSVVTLTVIDPFGCIGTSNKELDPSVCCTVPFPNAFTPNGDGINDVFRPIPQRAYHTYHEFRVQNRWGQTVFECNDNKASWDGNFNGVPQDMGVFYWYLKYDCDGKTMEEKGDVTLVR